jgi:hypothetical protein
MSCHSITSFFFLYASTSVVIVVFYDAFGTMPQILGPGELLLALLLTNLQW